MSFWSFRTAFTGLRPDNSSPIFEQFEQYRDVLVTRLTVEQRAAGSDKLVYDRNSQDVLIPAFFAAYSGSDPLKAKVSPFYNFPLPNWEVNYNGLSNLPLFKQWFTSFNVRHSYNSTYSVGNYTSSLDYGALYVNLAVSDNQLARSQIGNADGQFVPILVMSTITMQERFAPLIGINFQTRSRISARLDYNQSRNAALNLSNAQVADLTIRDLTASVGWTGKNFRAPFMRKPLKNDLTFNLQMSLYEERDVQRKLDAEFIIKGGSRTNFLFNPTVNYVVNKRLNVNIYFRRSFLNPLVSPASILATTSGGVQVRFNLAQ
jgi:cell surface protein SprA